MQKYILVLVCSPLVLAAPQLGFGDATPDEIAEIRAGTYLETFDESPVYNYNYQVADEVEQTYMAMNENRDGDVVTGQYQYVDPYGSLIVVKYTAGAMGYTETREVQENFVKINPRPQRVQATSTGSSSGSFSGSSFGSNSGSSFGSNSGSSFSSGSGSSSNFGSSNSGFSSSSNSGSTSSSSFNANDIVNAVVSQVTPLVSGVVSNAVSSQQTSSNTASRRPVAPRPVVQRPVAVATPLPVSSVASSSSSFSNDDIVSQVVNSIAPQISTVVASAVGGSSSRFSPASRPVPAPRAPAPRPTFRQPAPVPAARPVAASASAGSISDLFGSGGNFNVRINTPAFNIEY